MSSQRDTGRPRTPGRKRIFGVFLGHRQALAEATRKLCYRKDDRAMRPTYGCHDNFRDCLTTPTATIPNIFMGFWSDRLYECSYKI